MVAHKYRGHVHHLRVVLIEGSDRVLPMFDPLLSAKAYKRLKKLGVEMRLNTKVNSCEAGKVCVDSGDIDADVIVWTAGSRPVDFYANHPKVFELERGRVKVDSYLRAKGHEDVYVLGDNAFTRYTGMAQTALYDARFVTRNILREQQGEKPVAYRARHPIYVVPVGSKWAVYQTPKRQWSGYKAWVVRRQADRAIWRQFLPYKKAIKQWRKANRLADF
jgi:NADH dehydrogenase